MSDRVGVELFNSTQLVKKGNATERLICKKRVFPNPRRPGADVSTDPARTLARPPVQTGEAKISRTTRLGSTPVSFCSRPWNGYENRSWSMPNRFKMVAFRSLT